MEHRQLGNDGPMVSVIGLGTWPIAGAMGAIGDQPAIATIRAAIDHGITLLDTAQGYFRSEEITGYALKDGYRERCFLATKVSHKYSKQDILAAIDDSLRRMQVDYVDLYQVHSWRPEYPIEETMTTMKQLQDAGKIRYIGVSNFSADQMAQASQIARFHSDQPRYNMFNREIEAEILPFCEQHGIGILAHTPLAKGLLTGKYKPDATFTEDDQRSKMPRFQGETFAQFLAVAGKLNEIARDKGITLVQFAMAWLLQRPAVTCVLGGAKTPEQVIEYAGAAGVKFSQSELARIEEILSQAPKV
ncbi:MAG: aldo/keto reductase [Chloroflexi bacterium]|nr:aldo/keto reductase [Chloroflexota bacterium]